MIGFLLGRLLGFAFWSVLISHIHSLRRSHCLRSDWTCDSDADLLLRLIPNMRRDGIWVVALVRLVGLIEASHFRERDATCDQESEHRRRKRCNRGPVQRYGWPAAHYAHDKEYRGGKHH